MKKPVVATNVGGIPELMKDNQTGFLIEKGDADNWIEKLSLLIKDKQKKRRYGENQVRKFVEDNFSWDKIAGEFISIFKKIQYYESLVFALISLVTNNLYHFKRK